MFEQLYVVLSEPQQKWERLAGIKEVEKMASRTKRPLRDVIRDSERPEYTLFVTKSNRNHLSDYCQQASHLEDRTEWKQH